MFDFVIQKTRCCSSFRRRFEILFCCLVMCLGVCVPAWAAGYSMSDFSGAPPLLGGAKNVLYCVYTPSSDKTPCFVRLEFDTIQFTLDSTGGYSYLARNCRELRYWVDVDETWIYPNNETAGLSASSSSSFNSSVVFLSSTCDLVASDGTLVFPANASGGSGGEPSDYAYDSAIPAPQNLKLDFIKTSVGILGFSKRTDLQLSWTNALVDEYSVQISASITAEFTPGEGNQTHGKKTFTHKLVGLSQVDSGGPDSGYPASSGKYAITEDDLKAIAEDYLPDGPHVLERAYVDSFRVQFYKIDSGAVNVGPIAVVNLTYSVLGKYQGSTTTIEYPKDSADIGGGGLMPDDSDKWGGDGSGWEYDEDGNVTGSTGGSGSESWTDVLNGLLNSLLNIPTVIARLFDSLSSMMSGMSGLSGFIVQLFGFLPPDIVSLITLAIPIVIVLRIVGR